MAPTARRSAFFPSARVVVISRHRPQATAREAHRARSGGTRGHAVAKRSRRCAAQGRGAGLGGPAYIQLIDAESNGLAGNFRVAHVGVAHVDASLGRTIVASLAAAKAERRWDGVMMVSSGRAR
jgi:hypothetical protein